MLGYIYPCFYLAFLEVPHGTNVKTKEAVKHTTLAPTRPLTVPMDSAHYNSLQSGSRLFIWGHCPRIHSYLPGPHIFPHHCTKNRHCTGTSAGSTSPPT